MDKRPTVLFTTPVLGHPPIGGPQLRIENSIKALSQISDLYICSMIHISRREANFYRSICKDFLFIYNNEYYYFFKRATKFILRNLFEPLYGNIDDPKSNFPKVLEIADTIEADIIWLGYGNISYPLLKYIKENSKYKVVCDTDSVWSRFILRGLPFAKTESKKREIEKEGKLKEEEEKWGTKIADVTTAVSEVDAEYYRQFAEHLDQVRIFSNVIDTEMYKDVPKIAQEIIRPSIYLAGSFGHNSPMEEAALWTIDEVLPLVKRQIPDIHFYIVGNKSDIILEEVRDPAITITGQVPSVLPYLCNVDVALVPLKFESGTRFKILEAGACGIPVVSTTLGAEGIPVTNDKDIVIADDASQFADAIIKIISNLEFSRKISKNLQQLIYKQYSIQRLCTEGQEILDCLLK